MRYNVTYIHPNNGDKVDVVCDDTRLNVVAGDTFFMHCEAFTRCHIIDVTPAETPVLSDLTRQINKYRPMMQEYMRGYCDDV